MLTLIIILWILWALCRPRYGCWYHRPPMGGFYGWHRPMHPHRPMGGFGGMHMGGFGGGFGGGHMGGFGGGFGGGGRTMGGGAGRGRR